MVPTAQCAPEHRGFVIQRGSSAWSLCDWPGAPGLSICCHQKPDTGHSPRTTPEFVSSLTAGDLQGLLESPAARF